jgi:hypothetical protein
VHVISDLAKEIYEIIAASGAAVKLKGRESHLIFHCTIVNALSMFRAALPSIFLFIAGPRECRVVGKQSSLIVKLQYRQVTISGSDSVA